MPRAAKVKSPEEEKKLLNHYYRMELTAPSSKVRPCHIVGQIFLRTPGVVNSDGYSIHSLTPHEIYDAIGHIHEIQMNCRLQAATRAWNTIPAGPERLVRLPIWIGNLRSLDPWNGDFGGARIETIKVGQKTIRYDLYLPPIDKALEPLPTAEEMKRGVGSPGRLLNIWGQVMGRNKDPEYNKAEIRHNEQLKAYISESLDLDHNEAFPGTYNTILGEPTPAGLQMVVPNDPITGEPLLTFWKDQYDSIQIPEVIPEEAPVVEYVAEEHILDEDDVVIEEGEEKSVEDFEKEIMSLEDDEEEQIVPADDNGRIVISDTPRPKRVRPSRAKKAA